jgi:hypothetical protein
MALKDWKKTSWIGYGSHPGIIYKSTKEYPINHLILIYKKGKLFRFEDNKDMSSIRDFKTKKRALAYAKSYMRTH